MKKKFYYKFINTEFTYYLIIMIYIIQKYGPEFFIRFFLKTLKTVWVEMGGINHFKLNFKLRKEHFQKK